MKQYFVAALAIALFTAPGSAQVAFGTADLDRDGRLGEAEFYSAVSDAGLYGRWDRDDDGLIEEREFNQIGVAREFGDFDTWDADDNEYLDAVEFYDGVYRGFDRDESGQWDATEWDDAGEAGWFDL